MTEKRPPRWIEGPSTALRASIAPKTTRTSTPMGSLFSRAGVLA
ncbi:hypothetical protein DB32_003273 [Sandaracinus amylolyticus]|uniref:Uncharacterized protein n=1 Tax=Sandaracinus amylolyticus TaxID=927083 RepID=A0A0F6SF09_9BACT|nr:hypothetical protein DB32_003273 [Sandaracinus amylolyticus]